MKHTDIQASCSGSEPEFAFGEIYGLRQWTLNGSGDLVGHRNFRWPLNRKALLAVCDATHHLYRSFVVPSEFSDAAAVRFAYECAMLSVGSSTIVDHQNTRVRVRSPRNTIPATFRLPDMITDLYDDKPRNSYTYENHGYLAASAYPSAPLGVTTESWSLELEISTIEHPISHPECTCGFYAYTDWNSLKDNSYTGATTKYVYGLVKGYGRVTIGTKGFRAEKAHIVALTWPQVYTGPLVNSHDTRFSRNAEHLTDFMSPIEERNYTVWRESATQQSIPLVANINNLEDFMSANNISLGF